MSVSALQPTATVGRYAVFGEIASGGMASVCYGCILGAHGFTRTVAIKRLHPQFAREQAFVSMFLEEARLAARIRHRNVVSVLDVLAEAQELLLVMEYVPGEALSKVLRRAAQLGHLVPVPIACSIMVQALEGLHAAHETTDASGARLELVHRDVSPQNILVGADGAARVLDFGIAKATESAQTTRSGQVKGKPAYMAPEQARGEGVTPRSDVFAASIVLWELLVGERLFRADNDYLVFEQILHKVVDPPSHRRSDIPPMVDEVVARGLARETAARYTSAQEMARALAHASPLASEREISAWLESLCGDTLRARAEALDLVERSARDGHADRSARSERSLPAVVAAAEATVLDAPVRRSSRRPLLALLAGAAVLMATTVLVLRTSPALLPKAPASAPLPESSPAPPASAPPSMVLAPPAPLATASVRPAHGRVPATKKLPPPPAVRSPCTNPFRIDPDGTKVPRPECFRN